MSLSQRNTEFPLVSLHLDYSSSIKEAPLSKSATIITTKLTLCSVSLLFACSVDSQRCFPVHLCAWLSHNEQSLAWDAHINDLYTGCIQYIKYQMWGCCHSFARNLLYLVFVFILFFGTHFWGTLDNLKPTKLCRDVNLQKMWPYAGVLCEFSKITQECPLLAIFIGNSTITNNNIHINSQITISYLPLSPSAANGRTLGICNLIIQVIFYFYTVNSQHLSHDA